MAAVTLVHLLKLVIELEIAAMRYYQRLSDRSESETEKTFWRRLSTDEGSHIAFWETLLALAEKKQIRNLFDDPAAIHDELLRVRTLCGTLMDEAPGDIGRSLTAAVRIEFYMLHPAFAAMFHLYRDQIEGGSPETSYHDHLHFLMKGFGAFQIDRPEYVLIAQMLEQIWQTNRKLARHLAEVRTLRGLIPICMHCKKIRNEDGFWVQVERYVSAHSDAEFSHGICEQCIQEHYPDLV
ncbi:MAG TPA: hypothetical protein ENN17_03400 [bacterium]|nr:hypothetical protein [bacterium]